jgi:hypothetical protein
MPAWLNTLGLMSLPKCMARRRSASGLMPVGPKQSAAMYPAHRLSPWP